MKNLDRLTAEAKDFPQFAKSYMGYLAQLCEGLDFKSLELFMLELEDARQKGQTVFIIGNGGSASTASHMATDLSSASPEKPFRVLSLTDNTPLLTSLANDHGYEQVFLRQLKLYAQEGDKLIVISASGNSKNIIEAAKWFKSKGRVLGFLGFDGGQMKGLCDVAVVVETSKGEYGPVEDVHMILDHLLFTWIRRRGTHA